MLKKLTEFWTNLHPYEKAGTAALIREKNQRIPSKELETLFVGLG